MVLTNEVKKNLRRSKKSIPGKQNTSGFKAKKKLADYF